VSDPTPRLDLARLLAAGAAGGLGATAVEGLYLYLRGVLPHAAAGIPALSLATAIYCGGGISLGALIYGSNTVVSGLQSRRRSTAAAGSTALSPVLGFLVWTFYMATLALVLGVAFYELASLRARPMRAVTIAMLAGLVAPALTRPVYTALRVAAERASGAGSARLRALGAAGAAVVVAVTLLMAVRDSAAQLTYSLAIAEGGLLPFLIVALGRFRVPAWLSVALVVACVAETSFVVIKGVSPGAQYIHRLGRTFPSRVLEELPVLHGDAQLAEVRAAVHDGIAQQVHLQLAAAPEPPVRLSPVSRASAADIVLITIDTLRADRLVPNDGATTLMPALARFASQGTLFTHAFASAPQTVSAFTQLLTGRGELHVPHVPGSPNSGRAVLRTDVATLAARLGRIGYTTHAILGNQFTRFLPSIGLGFDSIDDWDEPRNTYLSADGVFTDALEWVAPPDAPSFLWLYMAEPHEYPLESRKLRSGYDKQVAFVDAQMGRFFEGLERSRRWTNTVVIVTADHGEGLGEGGLVSHGIPSARVQAIPLVLRDPATAGRRVDATVGHLDIAATVLAAAGIATPDLVGRDLRHVTEARPWPLDQAPFENSSYSPFYELPLCSDFGVVSFPWMYFYEADTDTAVLIDLAHDPDGLVNRAGEGLAEEAVLRKLVVSSLRR